MTAFLVTSCTIGDTGPAPPGTPAAEALQDVRAAGEHARRVTEAMEALDAAAAGISDPKAIPPETQAEIERLLAEAEREAAEAEGALGRAAARIRAKGE